MALDFPSNPVDGQIYGNFYYSSAKAAWRATTSFNTPNALKNATVTTTTSSGIPLTVQGTTSQLANLQEWKNSLGTVLAKVDSTGVITSSGPFKFQSSGVTNLVLGSTADANAAIEIGRQDGTASTPYIDFHAGASVVDYDVRIIAQTGTGSVGGGTLQVQAGQLTLPTNTYSSGLVSQAQGALTRGYATTSKSTTLTTTSTTFSSIISKSIVTKFANSAIFVMASATGYSGSNALRGKAQLTRNGTEINADMYAFYADISTFAFHQFSQLDYPNVAAGTTLTYSYNASSSLGASIQVGYGDGSGGPGMSMILLEVAQ